MDKKLIIKSSLHEATLFGHFEKTNRMIQEHNSNPDATFEMEHNMFSTMVILVQERLLNLLFYNLFLQK